MAADDVPTRRSAEQIRERLLKRAFEGQSRYSVAEMMDLIHKHQQRAHEIPIEHEVELWEIEHHEPRAVRALNLIEKAEGTGRRFTGLPGMKPPTSSIN